MERDFGILVEYVLVEICAYGEDGIFLSELFTLVEKLYDIRHAKKNEDYHTSTEVAGSLEETSNIIESLRPISYHDFKISFWQSLLAHPDVIISDDRINGGESAAELETFLAESEPFRQDEDPYTNQSDLNVSIDGNNILESAGQPPEKSPRNDISEDHSAITVIRTSKPEESPRVYVDKDRLWRTLTGHGFDNKKIPNPEWQCFCAIAAHLGGGIMEADLAQQLGPDKSTVLKRAKFLVQGGYVEKRKVPGHGPRNCLLICKTLKTRTKTLIRDAAQTSPKMVHLETGFVSPELGMSSTKGSVAESTQDFLRSIDPNNEPQSNSRAVATVDSLTEGPTNSPPDSRRGDGRLLGVSSRRSAQRKNYLSEFGETSKTINSPDSAITSKSRSKVTTSKTYEEYRREDGFPGVYFDLPNLSRPATPGRPRKRMLAVFKSEKLKHATFMQEYITLAKNPLADRGHDITSQSHPNKAPEPFQFAPLSANASHENLGNFARFTTLYQSPYQSPYLSSTGLPLIPLSAASLSSKYQYLGATTPYQKTYQSPYTASALPQNVAETQEPRNSTTYGSGDDCSNDHAPIQQVVMEANDFDEVADDELQAAIAAAESILIPDCASRLACSLKEVAGNLVLSTDMKLLAFVAAGEAKATSALVLKVSDICKPPTISTADAFRPALLITTATDDDERVTVIHHFRFHDGSIQMANNCRAKIVTAMTILEFGGDDLTPDRRSKTALPISEKFFKCDTCSGSWKNVEGLKYHKTKAMVPCNPNFTLPAKSQSRKPKRIAALAGLSDLYHKSTEVGSFSEILDLNNVESLGSDEDAQNPEFGVEDDVAGKTVTDQELSAFEVSVGKAKEEDPFGRDTSEAEPTLAQNAKRTTRKRRNYVTKTATLEATKRRKDVIMSLLERNSGVFPGDRGLWYGLVTSWVVQFPHSRFPQYGEINSALALLEDSGQVQKIYFSFRDESGLMRMRTIITKREIDPRDPGVTGLKEAIKAKFPEFYVPPQFAPPNTVQSMLESIEARPSAVVEVSTPASSIDDVESIDGLIPAIDFGEVDDEDDDDYVDGSKNRRRRSQRSTRGKRANWSTDYTPSRKRGRHPSNSNNLKPGSTRGPSGTPSHHQQSQSISQTWQPALAQLQDPLTGAWKIVPPNFSVSSSKIIESPVSKWAPRAGVEVGKQKRQFSALESQLDTGSSPKRMRPQKFVSYEGLSRESPESHFADNLTSIPDFRPRKVLEFSSLRSNERSARDRNSGLDSVASGGSVKSKNLSGEPFINVTLPSHRTPSQRKSANLVWSHTNAFTLETLPYEELETEDEDEGIGDIPISSTRRAYKRRKSSNLYGFGGFNQKKTRRMTALPADVDGLIESISRDPELHVEIDYEQVHSIRKRTDEHLLSKKLEDRILLTIIVIRTLTGGLDRLVDWVLVSRLHPEVTMHFIQRRWTGTQQSSASKIDKLSAKFQDFYVEAYEAGDVPAINYDQLLDYDFDSVIDLFENHTDLTATEASSSTPTPITTAPNLPSTRTSLNKHFSISEAEECLWRDEFFSHMPPVHKRMDHAASAQYTIGIDHLSHKLSPEDETSFMIAKSWIRANSVTPMSAYNSKIADRKLSQIPAALLHSATQSLLSARILIYKNRGRTSPGRAFETSEVFNSAFRKRLSETQLAQAVAYKAVLDESLRAGQDVTVRWDANDGTVLALTNMQAWGRITIKPRNYPREKFGLTPVGTYQTKHMDKKKLRFDLVIARTATYAFGRHDTEVLGRVREKPPASLGGMIPVWCDISEELIPDLWRKLLCAILGTVAFRPGMPVSEIVTTFKPALEAWEVRLLMEWAVRAGAVEKCGDGEREGWTVAEWWWLVGGLA